jgi:hypothetical protein
MTKVPVYITFFFVLVVLLLSGSSCRKSDRNKDNDLQSARDISLAYAGWNDLNRQLNVFAGSLPDLNPAPGPYVNTACGTVSVTPALPNPTFPKVATINYGNVNCTGPDGAVRKGMIVATFTGNYRDSLTVITITPSNYYFNGFKIDGTFTITNKGRNAAGNPVFTDNAANVVYTYPSGKTVSWNSTQTREMTQGSTTPDIFDDIYQLNGTGVATGSEATLINTYISQPIVFSLDCPWIKSGTLYVDPVNLGNRYINFGTGNCDNKATVWIFGANYSLDLY